MIPLLLWICIPAFSQCPPATSAGVHVVQKGETLFGISRNYGISVDQIRELNNLNAADNIYPCNQLVVFLSGPQAPSAAPAPTTYGSTPTYMNATSLAPKSTTATTPPPQTKSHTVKRGETMAQLAYYYGYTEAKFRAFNGFNAFREPNVGEVLQTEHCSCPAPSASPTTYSNPVLANQVSSAFAKSPNAAGGTPMPTTYSNSPVVPTTFTNSTKTVSDDRSYMTPTESAMINEINLMRSNPSAYVAFVEDFVRNYPIKFRRQIDRRYVNSLISDLRNSPRLSTLIAHPCLYQVATGHGQYLRSVNGFSHTGSGGSSPASRTQAACQSLQLATTTSVTGNLVGNENLVGGYTNVREAVIGLLIDEGRNVPGHRETLLAPEWRYVAVSDFGTSGNYPNNFVQLFGR